MVKNNSWLKLFIILCLSLFAAFSLAGYLILNSPWFWRSALKNLPITAISQGTVESISFEQARSALPAKFSFKNIKLQIKGVKDTYDIKVDQLFLDASALVLKTASTIECRASGINLEAKGVSIFNADLNLNVFLKNGKAAQIDGELKIPEVNVGTLAIKEVKSHIKGDLPSIELGPMTASLYEGTWQGSVKLTYAPLLTYESSGHFEKVNLAALRSVSEEVFSKLRGKASGDIYFQGDTADVAVMKIYVNIPEEGQIKASLLKPLIQNIPKNSSQYKDLELLMKVDGFVLLDVATLNLDSVDKEHLKGTLNLESNRFDLNVKLSTDINLEGGLMSSFENFQRVFSIIGGGV